MSRILRAMIVTVAVLGPMACGTTTFTSTWSAPGTQVSPVGRTVAAVFVSAETSQRRAAEDALAADLNQRGAHGIAAYTVVPDTVRADGDAARAALVAAGATGAVIMRVVSTDQEITITPGRPMPTSYSRFGPSWRNSWGTPYSPSTVRTDTIVSIETLVYSLKTDELLWASTSRTTNPRNVDALVREVAAATASQMARQGLLASQ